MAVCYPILLDKYPDAEQEAETERKSNSKGRQKLDNDCSWEPWGHRRRLLASTEGHSGTKGWSGGFWAAEPAGGLASLLHPCPSFPWVLLVVTNRLEWLLLRRILSLRWLPSIHHSPPCLMDCSAKVVGGICVCAHVYVRVQGLRLHILTFPCLLLIILSMQSRWHLLDTDTFLIWSRLRLWHTVLVMWMPASSNISCV